MIDLAFVMILVAWAAGVGGAILRAADSVPAARTDRLALAVPIGFGAMALAALGLGELGWLNRPGFVGVFLIGTVLAFLANGRVIWRPTRAVVLEGEAPRGRPERAPHLAFDLALAVALLGTLLTALAPATDGDALCYHLQVPKVFLHAEGMTFEPDLHETVYPLVTEMLYAVALAFRGPIACRLIQWVLGVCFAGCVTALARPSLGARARWAGTIALLVPAVSNGMGAPLNDVALAAFANAALVALMLWHDRPTGRRAALAGIVAGLALGVKYPALVWVGVLGLAMMLAPNRGSKVRSVAIFSMTALAIGGAWYLRAFVHTGNPVYPFFRHAFGGAGIDDVLDPIKRPMAVTLPNLLTALGPMTLDPDRFDSLSHQFGPAFLLMVPGLFLLRPPRRVVAIAGVGYAFLTLCLTQRQSMRFLLAAMGPFAVATAWVAASWWERRSRPGRLIVAGLVAVLAFESAIAAGRARHGIAVAIGREGEASYLARREPTYRVGRWIDANLPPGSRIIGQEHRGYYLPRPYAMELAHRRRTGLGTRGESPEAIVATLHARGFTHLLLCPPEPETAVEFDPTLSRKLAPWLAARDPLYREAIVDPDGVTRLYAIYALGTARAAETRTARR